MLHRSINLFLPTFLLLRLLLLTMNMLEQQALKLELEGMLGEVVTFQRLLQRVLLKPCR